MIQHTQDIAIGIARMLEPIANNNGFHIALGGGCLHRGFSKKDIDIIIYAHTTFKEGKALWSYQRDRFLTGCAEVGFKPRYKGSGSGANPDDIDDSRRYKQVKLAQYEGLSVDLIFVLPGNE